MVAQKVDLSSKVVVAWEEGDGKIAVKLSAREVIHRSTVLLATGRKPRTEGSAWKV